MEGKGQNQLTGTVSHVIFQNKENGYTVLRLKTGQEEVTAVGILPQVTQGEQVILEGSWTDHPNFGRQFKAERAQRQMPSEKQGIYRYLASGVIKGIGPKLAERLVTERRPFPSWNLNRSGWRRCKAFLGSVPLKSKVSFCKRPGCGC